MIFDITPLLFGPNDSNEIKKQHSLSYWFMIKNLPREFT